MCGYYQPLPGSAAARSIEPAINILSGTIKRLAVPWRICHAAPRRASAVPSPKRTALVTTWCPDAGGGLSYRGYSARVRCFRARNAPNNSLAGTIKRSYPTRSYFSGMKHKPLYVEIVLAISGIAVLVVSMTMIQSEPKTLLGIVLGGALVQAGIAVFVIDWPKVRRTARRRSKP